MESSSEIIGRLAAIGPARRGQLTEQTYTVAGRDGKTREQEPYYVLTWSDGGEKKTRRIPASEVGRVREELRAGKEIDALILSYRRAKEAEADGEVTYARAHVRDAEGRWSFPLDAALGVVAGCTSPMAALLSRAGATAPSYGEAGSSCRRLPASTSPDAAYTASSRPSPTRRRNGSPNARATTRSPRF